MFYLYQYDSDTGQRKRIPLYNLLILFLILFFAGLFIGRKTVKCPENQTTLNFYMTPAPELCAPDFHKDSLKAFIKQLNLKYPDVVYAQTLLESKRYKSRLFRTHNNLFGMKQAGKRPYLTCGTKNNYAYYEDTYMAGWQLSVIDYALYQARYGKAQSKEEYLKKLESYAEDESYLLKLKPLLDEW